MSTTTQPLTGLAGILAQAKNRSAGRAKGEGKAPMKNTIDASQDMMDDNDRIADDGTIEWRYLPTSNSKSRLSRHLGLPEGKGSPALAKLMALPAVKVRVDELMARTAGNKNTWKPDTMIPIIEIDRNGARKYFCYKPNFDQFSAFDWYCYTLAHVKDALCTETDGPYYRKKVDSRYAYSRAWSLIKHIKWDNSDSRKPNRAERSQSQTLPSSS